jgi:hypothetical protein
MSRPQYFSQGDRVRANKIRDLFIEPAKAVIPKIHATENTDYRVGVPKQLNTVIYVEKELLAIADVRWRGRPYSEMEITKKNLYNYLVKWHEVQPDIPAFIVWAIGDKLDIRAWQYTPHEEYVPREGGRHDRGDDLDIELVIPIPYFKTETPKQVWHRAGILQ